MKYIFLIILFAVSQNKVQAQVDSSRLPISAKIPVKAVVIFAHYRLQSFAWEDRKLPDQLALLVGAGKPDSLTNITTTAGELYTFIQRVQSERYGAIAEFARSIFNNQPAISGYTALFTQIVNKANGNTSEKAAALWMVNRYNEWDAQQTAFYNTIYSRAFDLIKD